MPWPPRIGTPLPRAEYVWYEQRKLKWIFGKEGRVIASAMPEATVMEVRESLYGITCGVEVGLTINGRRALTRISWHYAVEISAPRLVTAYPTP